MLTKTLLLPKLIPDEMYPIFVSNKIISKSYLIKFTSRYYRSILLHLSTNLMTKMNHVTMARIHSRNDYWIEMVQLMPSSMQKNDAIQEITKTLLNADDDGHPFAPRCLDK